ncbi:MAG: bifunctional DNA-formamidopyrimidine glycosylase/DNA-(apurinic or apyrimidinic site) lyase [Eubacteriales bacterium]|nr:bifunctional DNA-formamidopyrimidine glycosylase/DNA-(apurinic or apyrimidinic site) lyase [Eubacteriales bacterium]
MPELPEVETIRRSLEELILGQRIIAVEVLTTVIFQNPASIDATGQMITSLRRRGKYLKIHLEDCFLLVHLRMTGKLLFHEALTEPDKHCHVRFTLEDGKGKYSYLDYQDVRKFGRIGLYKDEQEILSPGYARLGPDGLDLELVPEHLYALSRSFPKRSIKALLLDQDLIAGLGNIYVDEALFRARIRPDRASGRISKQRLCSLQAIIPPLLEESIGFRGTSFSDYVDGLGKKGSFSSRLAVYGRKGEHCLNCDRPLKSIKVAGRTTVFCPHCQR